MACEALCNINGKRDLIEFSFFLVSLSFCGEFFQRECRLKSGCFVLIADICLFFSHTYLYCTRDNASSSSF